jgi:phosphoenolpyruvate synthase/pyruvate phosphate dikinase
VGGKALSLNQLMIKGFNVPPGVVVPASFFLDCLQKNGIMDEVNTCCERVNFENIHYSSEKLRDLELIPK